MSATRFSLRESGGPVSPRYQYELAVDVEAAPAGAARVTVASRRPEAAGGSREVVADLDAERFRALCEAIGDGHFHDAVPDGPRRVGISINTVTLHWPDRPVATFRYTLAEIDDPPHAAELAVVEALRGLARSTLGD